MWGLTNPRYLTFEKDFGGTYLTLPKVSSSGYNKSNPFLIGGTTACWLGSFTSQRVACFKWAVSLATVGTKILLSASIVSTKMPKAKTTTHCWQEAHGRCDQGHDRFDSVSVHRLCFR